jgi:hypothetical protein
MADRAAAGSTASVDGVRRAIAVLVRHGLEAVLEEHWARQGTAAV